MEHNPNLWNHQPEIPENSRHPLSVWWLPRRMTLWAPQAWRPLPRRWTSGWCPRWLPWRFLGSFTEKDRNSWDFTMNILVSWNLTMEKWSFHGIKLMKLWKMIEFFLVNFTETMVIWDIIIIPNVSVDKRKHVIETTKQKIMWWLDMFFSAWWWNHIKQIMIHVILMFFHIFKHGATLNFLLSGASVGRVHWSPKMAWRLNTGFPTSLKILTTTPVSSSSMLKLC